MLPTYWQLLLFRSLLIFSSSLTIEHVWYGFAVMCIIVHLLHLDCEPIKNWSRCSLSITISSVPNAGQHMPASFVVSSVIDIQQVYLLVITIMILSNEQPWISQWHIKLTLAFVGQLQATDYTGSALWVSHLPYTSRLSRVCFSHDNAKAQKSKFSFASINPDFNSRVEESWAKWILHKSCSENVAY